MSCKQDAKRPLWEALIDEAGGQPRAGDRIAVVEPSRLGRSTGKLDELLHGLQRRQIDLRILNMDIDTSTPSGKLMFRIMTALAESERDLIAERTKPALDAKRRRGERVGGRKPTHTPEQVARAMHMLDTIDMTGQEIAGAVGMSRSRMYALVARLRAEKTG